MRLWKGVPAVTPYQTIDTKYRRTARRKRKKRRRRFTLFLFLAIFALVAYKLSDGFSSSPGGAQVPMDNIETDFSVDTSALTASITGSDSTYAASRDDIDALQEIIDKYPNYADEIEFLIDHIGVYSQEAVNTILLSPEKTDFVLLAPFAEPVSDTDAGISVKNGEIPFLLQYDSRWAFHRYGNSCMGYTACGPTCLSMAAIGLSGNTEYTPPYVSDYAESSGFYVSGTGTSWSLFTDGAAYFGLHGEVIPVHKNTMGDRLDAGSVLIASMLPGDFTKNGHFIVICSHGLNGFHVYDPSNMERSGETWRYDDLAPQIAQLWSLSKA
jgi:hypothetical protein